MSKHNIHQPTINQRCHYSSNKVAVVFSHNQLAISTVQFLKTAKLRQCHTVVGNTQFRINSHTSHTAGMRISTFIITLIIISDSIVVVVLLWSLPVFLGLGPNLELLVATNRITVNRHAVFKDSMKRPRPRPDYFEARARHP